MKTMFNVNTRKMKAKRNSENTIIDYIQGSVFLTQK